MGGRLVRNRPLDSLSWLRVGGMAEWFFQPGSVTELQEFLADLPRTVPVFVLGAGSNVIIRDGGLPGVVIRLGKPFSGVRISGTTIRSGSGMLVRRLAVTAAEQGLDLAFYRTIPGTVGGAIRMNAGCYGSYTADRVVSATVIGRNGTRRKQTSAELGFGYRKSTLGRDDIIIDATFACNAREPCTLLDVMKKYSEHRAASQPTGIRTAGSTFRNPSGRSSAYGDADKGMLSAWRLIDDAGLRGYQYGDAQVSELHPNFLINLGSASATDMEELGEHVRDTVFKSHGVQLKWEVDRVGLRLEGSPSEDTGPIGKQA